MFFLKSEALVNLIGLFRVMSDEHYAIFTDSLKYGDRPGEDSLRVREQCVINVDPYHGDMGDTEILIMLTVIITTAPHTLILTHMITLILAHMQEFITDVLECFRSLIAYPAHPPSWLVLYLAQNRCAILEQK